MKVFKDGGSYSLKTVKYELLSDGVEGIKDTVTFESRDNKDVTFLVGRKVVVGSHCIVVEYKLTRTLMTKHKECTDAEIAKMIAENPQDVTNGFYAYVSSMITTIAQIACNLPAVFTSTDYISD